MCVRRDENLVWNSKKMAHDNAQIKLGWEEGERPRAPDGEDGGANEKVTVSINKNG